MSLRGVTLLLTVALHHFLYDVTTAHCFHGNARKLCLFTCHCADDTPCNITSGACPGGCHVSEDDRHTWSGAGCQIGNIALGRDAFTFHGGYDLGARSVDGNLTTTANIKSNRNEYIHIDLHQNYVVQSGYVNRQETDRYKVDVALLGKEDEVMVTRRIYGTDTVYFDNALADGFKVIALTATVPRSYGDPHVYHTTTVQDVVIKGYQYEECVEQDGGQFYYGPGCLLSCGEGCAEQCDYITGQGCSQCHPGYQGHGCRERCRDGYWGPGCGNTCNCDDVTEVCSKARGQCPQSGCLEWYTGEGCDYALPRMGDLELPEVANLTDNNVTLTFEQLDLAAQGREVDSTTYRIKHYRTTEDEASFIQGLDVPHVPGSTNNSVWFQLPPEQNVYHMVCVVPYDVTRAMVGEPSPCVGVYVDDECK